MMAEVPPPPDFSESAPQLPKAHPFWELWRAIMEGLRARADLIALDVHRAGLAVAQMLILVLMCVFLLWTTWFTLMAGAVLAFIHWGWSSAWGVAFVVVINLLVGFWLWQRVSMLVHYLTLPAVRAHLMGKRDHE